MSSITSVITTYLGSRNKEIEDQLYAIFQQDTIPEIRKVERLIFTIFKEIPLSMKTQCRPFSVCRYTIETNDREKLIDNAHCPFRGGINISAEKLSIFIRLNNVRIKKELSPLI